MNQDYKKLLINELIAQGVTDPAEQAGVLAQIEAESNFRPVEENLNYSAEGLVKTFSSRIPGKTKEDKLKFASNLVKQGNKAIGDLVYSNIGGYDYRGRGFIQLTGKENYKKYGDLIGEDLVNNPERALDPLVSAKLAVAYMRDRNPDKLYDPTENTKAVAPSGWKGKIKERGALQKKWQAALGDIAAAPADVTPASFAQSDDPFVRFAQQGTTMSDAAPVAAGMVQGLTPAQEAARNAEIEAMVAQAERDTGVYKNPIQQVSMMPQQEERNWWDNPLTDWMRGLR